MNFTVLTLFPEIIQGYMSASIMGRALEKGLVTANVIDIRDYSCNKHNRVDDYPYGGGAGMVMEAEPVYKACETAKKLCDGKNFRMLCMSPAGRTFDQKMAGELAGEDNIIILCGHYEGIDERVLELEFRPEDYVSIGDYVLTGGELPALTIMDAVSRLIPGVLNNEGSAVDESFENGLLEYPQYTRPEEFMGKKVPEILLSGHHLNIDRWRLKESIIKTLKFRPDIISECRLEPGKTTRKLLAEIADDPRLSDEDRQVLDKLLKRNG
ncbi:MAG: tRNA (guanosine(37)-N1)-methyltransferase TrmD [Lachnospiraceae bacterium]|nr:tRNA (guanosine(37)-N1)-methyltransferase TrmD [Lachnospiraceae bacterium]